MQLNHRCTQINTDVKAGSDLGIGSLPHRLVRQINAALALATLSDLCSSVSICGFLMNCPG